MQNMEREPMVLSVGRPGMEALRIAAQRARELLRASVNVYKPRTAPWWDFAIALQIMDEGSLGVVDMLLLFD